MKWLFLFLFLFILFAVRAQNINEMSFDQLQKKLSQTGDSIVVVNFWATWCKPCVEELPYFEQLNKKYSSRKVKVLLVNLDFNSKVKSTAEPFAKNKKLESEIIHITDTDPNLWINKIDRSWSGAIPATVIYDASHKKIKFTEGETTFKKLESDIQQLLKK
jgi:thiol-disulfide isomerase/thioredoxin